MNSQWFYRRWLWLAPVPILWLIWYLVPYYYSSDHVHFTIHHGGTPRSVTFVVRDREGKPLPGLSAGLENFSGSTQGITDGNGIATVYGGEPEVLSVWIGGNEFRFYPRILDQFFSPDCSKGLTLKVTVKP